MADRITAGTITSVEVDRIVVRGSSTPGGLVCPEVAWDISSSVAQYNNSAGFFDKSVRPVRTAKGRLIPRCIRTDFTLALIDVRRGNRRSAHASSVLGANTVVQNCEGAWARLTMMSDIGIFSIAALVQLIKEAFWNE